MQSGTILLRKIFVGYLGKREILLSKIFVGYLARQKKCKIGHFLLNKILPGACQSRYMNKMPRFYLIEHSAVRPALGVGPDAVDGPGQADVAWEQVRIRTKFALNSD